MKRKFRITKIAQADLKSILKYTEQEWGKEKEFLLKNEFIQQFKKIAENPFASPLREEFDSTLGLRFNLFKRWYIVYWKAEPIEVFAIIDSSRNVPRLLNQYNAASGFK